MSSPTVVIDVDDASGAMFAEPDQVETNGDVSMVDVHDSATYYIFNTDRIWPAGSPGTPIGDAPDNTAQTTVPETGYILLGTSKGGPSLAHIKVTKTES